MDKNLARIFLSKTRLIRFVFSQIEKYKPQKLISNKTGDYLEEKGISYKQIIEELEKAKDENFHFSTGRVLSSMYTTPHDIAKIAHTMFIESNLGNPGLYPGTKRLEDEIIRMLGNLLHGNPHGFIVNGGTEANITALWIAKKLTKKNEVIFPKSAHFSFMKAVDLMGLKSVEIELNEKFQIDIDSVEEKLSKNTMAVVGVAGTTELGVIDPIEKLSELCNDNYFLHVDAAFGGFVIPFLKELGYDMPKFDFELDGINTLTIDPHKMGMSTIPAGTILIREKEHADNISVDSPYLTIAQHATLSGTRNSAAVASTYAVMKLLGQEGYKKIVNNCMETTKYFVLKIEEIGLQTVIKPTMNVVGIKMKNPEKVKESFDKLGWKVSLAHCPKSLRIVIMPHVTKEIVDCIIPDLKDVCMKFDEI